MHQLDADGVACESLPVGWRVIREDNADGYHFPASRSTTGPDASENRVKHRNIRDAIALAALLESFDHLINSPNQDVRRLENLRRAQIGVGRDS